MNYNNNPKYVNILLLNMNIIFRNNMNIFDLLFNNFCNLVINVFGDILGDYYENYSFQRIINLKMIQI
jgi:hypothetical protein